MTADVHWTEITKENEARVLDQLKWFNLHRCDTNIVTYKDGRKRAILRIPIFCKLLDQNRDGTFFCKDYANRPQLCREFACLRAKPGTPKSTAEPASQPQG
jgi:Fe-S-cluster containining protein